MMKRVIMMILKSNFYVPMIYPMSLCVKKNHPLITRNAEFDFGF